VGKPGIVIGYPLIRHSCGTVVSNGEMDGVAGPCGYGGYGGVE